MQNLSTGLETVATTKEGGFEWNPTVVKSHEETMNEDGTRTYTVTIYDDLKLSDGTPVTVKNYVVFPMVFSSPVGVAAAGKDHQSGMTLEGFKTFNTYDGTEGSGTKELAGLRMIDDYTYSITVSADYANYFYAISYAGLSAYDVSLWIGDADVKDDGNGVYFTDDFYAKEGMEAAAQSLRGKIEQALEQRVLTLDAPSNVLEGAFTVDKRVAEG